MLSLPERPAPHYPKSISSLSTVIRIWRICTITSLLFIFDLHLSCLSDDSIFYVVGWED